MNKGDVVTIYQFPITQTKPEGEARLIELNSKSDELEYWTVHFLGDEPNEKYTRAILKENENE